MGAWIHCPRTMGHPQNSTKKHFLTTLRTVLPDLGKDGHFQEWFGIANDKATWEQTLTTYLTLVHPLGEMDVASDSAEEHEPNTPP